MRVHAHGSNACMCVVYMHPCTCNTVWYYPCTHMHQTVNNIACIDLWRLPSCRLLVQLYNVPSYVPVPVSVYRYWQLSPQTPAIELPKISRFRHDTIMQLNSRSSPIIKP